VGLHESRVVLTARTGRAGLRDRLEKLGFALSPEELDQAYMRFLSIADKKQEVFDEDLMAMLHEELQHSSEDWQLEYLHVSGGTRRSNCSSRTGRFSSRGPRRFDRHYRGQRQGLCGRPEQARSPSNCHGLARAQVQAVCLFATASRPRAEISNSRILNF